jgi:hypothetical protein
MNGALTGLAAAQSMFGATAQAAGTVGSSSGDGGSASAANVAEEAGNPAPTLQVRQGVLR